VGSTRSGTQEAAPRSSGACDGQEPAAG
jgi:hypothetical protein